MSIENELVFDGSHTFITEFNGHHVYYSEYHIERDYDSGEEWVSGKLSCKGVDDPAVSWGHFSFFCRPEAFKSDPAGEIRKMIEKQLAITKDE